MIAVRLRAEQNVAIPQGDAEGRGRYSCFQLSMKQLTLVTTGLICYYRGDLVVTPGSVCHYRGNVVVTTGLICHYRGDLVLDW